jgi:hypothetical protein
MRLWQADQKKTLSQIAVLLACGCARSVYARDMDSFEIFLAARFRDFPVLLAATREMAALWGPQRITVAVPSADVKSVQAGLGRAVEVIDENAILKGFDRESFRSRPIPHFPRSFGWYLQQFLKIEYCRQSEAQHCLVWDADTVPLVPLEFLDADKRVFLTTAEEFHKPYFHTIEELFGIPALSKTSFISQHMFVDCSAMRSMCRLIEERHAVGHWTSALGRILEKHPDSANLFSEYETYANYMLLFEPDKVVTRELHWARCESHQTWAVPRRQLAEARNTGLSFAAYESKDAAWSRAMLKSLEKAPEMLKRLAVTFALHRSGGEF